MICSSLHSCIDNLCCVKYLHFFSNVDDTLVNKGKATSIDIYLGQARQFQAGGKAAELSACLEGSPSAGFLG